MTEYAYGGRSATEASGRKFAPKATGAPPDTRPGRQCSQSGCRMASPALPVPFARRKLVSLPAEAYQRPWGGRERHSGWKGLPRPPPREKACGRVRGARPRADCAHYSFNPYVASRLDSVADHTQ
jgi:hypothetical protein